MPSTPRGSSFSTKIPTTHSGILSATGQCWLCHLGGCGGQIEGAHLLSKSKLRGIPGAFEYCRANAEILIPRRVCHNHNTGRNHDAKRNRAELAARLVKCYGRQRVEKALEGLRALSKTPPMEWRLEAILAHREEKP